MGGRVKHSYNAQCSQEPITRNMQLPHIPVTAFLQTDLFLFKLNANSDPRRNLSDQSQALT